ncbi:MAG TPA: hypothetical protein VGJ16_03520 [Pirellulales bacterium]|jgi:hypothetical protein
MIPIYISLAVAALGIEVGWVPLPEGGHEYTIQLEPEMLDVLRKQKDEVFSEVPPQVHVRRYRLLVGTGKLARVIGNPPTVATHENAHGPSTPTPADLASENPAQPERTHEDNLPVGEANQPADASSAGSNPPDTAAAVPRLAADEGGSEPRAPGKLEDGNRSANSLRTSTYQQPGDVIEVQKPPGEPNSIADGVSRPWMPFFVALVLLCCSLGANIYLAWAAWHARSQYRSIISNVRTSPAG